MVSPTSTSPQQEGCSSESMSPPCRGIRGIPKLPGERTLEKQRGCSCHPSPIPNLVEGKSLHYNSLVRVLTDGKWPLGLQEVVDLLIVHLRRREARSRPEEQGQSRNLFPRVWEG